MLGELFLDKKGKTRDYYIDGLIAFLHRLTHKLKLSGLGKYGLKEKDIELICRRTENKNNPVKLAVEDLIEIINNRL